MKKFKKISLELNKEVVTSLNDSNMDGIKGGTGNVTTPTAATQCGNCGKVTENGANCATGIDCPIIITHTMYVSCGDACDSRGCPVPIKTYVNC